MGEKTNIAWTDHTFNPVIGCTKVGPGCDHCYAEDQDSRKRWGGTTHWGPGVPRHRTAMSTWNQVIRWNERAYRSGTRERVFCASLADVFDNEWPKGVREDLWRLVEMTKHLDWLLLTKRIGNVRGMVPPEWLTQWPAHVRLMITVVNQEEADRDIPKLLELSCNNGVSYEPALDNVVWRPSWIDIAQAQALRRSSINWIIIGGESGSNARPFKVDWARNTMRRFKLYDVPVFVKQMGRHPQDYTQTAGLAEGVASDKWNVRWQLKDKAGADPAEWPEDLRVREFPR